MFYEYAIALVVRSTRNDCLSKELQGILFLNRFSYMVRQFKCLIFSDHLDDNSGTGKKRRKEWKKELITPKKRKYSNSFKVYYFIFIKLKHNRYKIFFFNRLKYDYNSACHITISLILFFFRTMMMV